MPPADDLRERAEQAACPNCGAEAVEPHYPDKVRCTRCGWTEAIEGIIPNRQRSE